MAFPETRLTLIHRIATGDDDSAWKQFLSDYWRPICLFARRKGNLSWDDAEDIAGQTLEIFSRKELLRRWLAAPRARFKTLMCSVVRNLTSNWNRTARGRDRRLLAYAEEWEAIFAEKAQVEDTNVFYGIWAQELLRNVIKSMMWFYHQQGRGNYFRVLHGRICDQLSNQQIASLLGIKVTDVENYYRHARQRLTEQLQIAVQREAERYAVGDDQVEEYHSEWAQLAEYFDANGGLEQAIRLATNDPEETH